MSLRLKLALLLSVVVAATLFVAWLFTGRTVIGPFTREVLDIYLDETVYAAQQIEAGVDPFKLGKALNLDIRVERRLPRPMEDGRRGPCTREERGGYPLVHCRGPRAPVALQTSAGWVLVRRDLDIGKPGKRIGQLLLGISVAVTLASLLIAGLALRPFRTMTRAMQRIATGELAHRLPERGGPELTEAARTFNRMADRVDSILRAERELMAGISHELRTPLARLRLELEMLREGPAAERRLDAMEGDLTEIDQLIGELLESSRLALGERTLASGPVELVAVVEEARRKVPLPEHTLVVRGEAATVRGDHQRLVRVLGNLLANAGKYAPAGTEITVELDGAAVRVLDRGPGLPEEELAHVFEPFFRGSVARREGKAGLGLGLSLVRQIVTLHGGEVLARNRPGGGLAIELTLPPADRGEASWR